MAPTGLWSLSEVLHTYAWNLVNHTDTLTLLREDLKKRLDADSGIHFKSCAVDTQDRKNIKAILGMMRPWLEAHSLKASCDRLNRIADLLADEESEAPQPIITALATFSETLEDELKRRYFLYIPADDAELYQQPAILFPKTVAAFPSTHEMINGACQCYALDQHTACVFHCMGILQAGLYAQATALNVTLTVPLHLAQWHMIIQLIEAKIVDMRKALPKGDLRDDLVTFHAQAASQFRYFKDAWRNHVAHMRDVYDRDMAHSIMTHTKDFMEHLSTRLNELPIPALSVELPTKGGIQ